MNKQVILTGLRANNDLHIGNYLGALLPMVDMAKKRAGHYQVNLFVPDLHSFTTPIDHNALQEGIMQNLRVFAAAGLPLDHDDVRIYRQSYVPAHSELTWILDCFTGFGRLNSMTQFKDKAQSAKVKFRHEHKALYDALAEGLKKHRSTNDYKAPTDKLVGLAHVIEEAGKREIAGQIKSLAKAIYKDINDLHKQQLVLYKELDELRVPPDVSTGLFNYPVLMAADILLYDTSYVPVGDDQTQHLEFTRDIADRMNNRFGELFIVPEPVKKQHEFFGKDQGLRVKDLLDPTKKMSKSDETGKGVIFLTDTPEQAAKKIMGATTDSFGEIKYDTKERPGISNLLQMHALLAGENLQTVIEHRQGQTNYGDLKKEVAGQIKEFLAGFQAKLAQVDNATITAKLEKDEATMREQANATLLKVQRAVGLRAQR